MASFSTRLPLVLATLLALLMLAALGWQGYSQWQQETQAPTGQVDPAIISPAGPAQNEPQIKASEVALFGSASQSATEQPVDTENLPETNLRLVLRGVMAAEGDFPGSALIEDTSANTDVYLVGDELPGNATLRSVHSNRVIINRSGKLENLYFPELTASDGMEFAANEQYTELPQQDAAQQPAVTPQPVTSEATEQRRQEIRQRLEELRERLRNNSN
ncbi:type II secretion system protein N [Marinobacter zhejiangensis]|uniref:Type II secretion system protein C (GspC) n=1 Tax=Marinobacter zhejiangensis TaxID=488535 RepID=A0A1I4PDU9_9GAMM|nr:type II secretion system protein N [Marinobacter zhejiangensis]SFM25726.1 type II secretion system protein C (GspC) [Marinobacter zhejiangensis]